MLRSLYQVLSAATLLILCLSCPGLVLSQSTLTGVERAEVVRAVLEAEQMRQGRAFESITQLSTENISSLNPARFAADFKLTLLTPNEIKVKAMDYIGAHYLVFTDFKIEGERAVVRLAAVKEVKPCFGPYQKHQTEFTYRLEKTGNEWKAKLVGHPLASPFFGVKPDIKFEVQH